MAWKIKKVSHGSHKSPPSHFAVPTIGGMALSPSLVRTLSRAAAHRANSQQYPGPTTREGKSGAVWNASRRVVAATAWGLRGQNRLSSGLADRVLLVRGGRALGKVLERRQQPAALANLASRCRPLARAH